LSPPNQNDRSSLYLLPKAAIFFAPQIPSSGDADKEPQDIDAIHQSPLLDCFPVRNSDVETDDLP
jgi:hypothetical protein